jgi:SPP1 family phage portal protein
MQTANDLSNFTYNSSNINRFISGMNDQENIENSFLTEHIYLNDNDVLLAAPGFDITQNLNEVLSLLSAYDALRQVYHAKMRVYKGDHEAIKRLKIHNSLMKSSTKVMANLGKNIVNTFAGTFASIPIKVNYNDPNASDDVNNKMNSEIQSVMSFSNAGDVFFEWAKKSDIYGRSYAIAYKGSDGNTKFTSLSPENCIVVYDNSLEQNKLFAVRFQNINGSYYGELYTNDKIYPFSNSVDNYSTDNSTPLSESSGNNGTNGLSDDNWAGDDNPFGVVPISELPENDERSGLLDDIAPLMDLLDESLTAQHSDVMYFSNALLIIKGKTLSEDEKKAIKNWHVVTVDNEDSNKLAASDLKFLDKPQNDSQQEHHIKHLKDEIYETSQVINLSDPSLGSSASGDALEKKLQPMVMLADSKARKMDAAIKDLLRVIFRQSQLVDNSNIESVIANITVKFTVNIPHNLLDVSNIVKNLNGIVSKPLQLSFIPGLEDISGEIQEEKSEQNAHATSFEQMNDPSEYPDNNSNDGSDENDS